MDRYVGFFEDRFNEVLEVLVISAALGIEDKLHVVSVLGREELLVVLLCESLVLFRGRLFLRRLLLHVLECIVIDVLLRTVYDVDEVHYSDRKEVAPRPIETYSCGNDKSEECRERDHEYCHAPLRELVLLDLQDVDPVLDPAHEERGKSRNDRNKEYQIYMENARCLCEIDSEEVCVQSLNRLDRRIRSGNVRKFRCVILHEIYGGELCGRSEIGNGHARNLGGTRNESVRCVG